MDTKDYLEYISNLFNFVMYNVRRAITRVIYMYMSFPRQRYTASFIILYTIFSGIPSDW